MAQIRDPGGVRDPAAAVCHGFHRTGDALVLQMDLSFGHPYGRFSHRRQRTAAGSAGLFISMEADDPDLAAAFVHRHLSAIL